jgi:hypothetical protein
MTGAFFRSLSGVLLALAGVLSAMAGCSGGRTRPSLPPPVYEEPDTDAFDAGAPDGTPLAEAGTSGLSSARTGPRS